MEAKLLPSINWRLNLRLVPRKYPRMYLGVVHKLLHHFKEGSGAETYGCTSLMISNWMSFKDVNMLLEVLHRITGKLQEAS